MSRGLTVQSEANALAVFWRGARPSMLHRIELLQLMAQVRVRRPADWSRAAVRAEFEAEHRRRRHPSGCLSCLSNRMPRVWHHIVQVQHGGSNSSANLVSICTYCHARIHPWLTPIEEYDGLIPAAELIRRHFPNGRIS